MSKLALLSTWVVLALPTLAADRVIVVDDDGGPGVDYTHLQDAIEAAADHDLVLVREGNYSGMTIEGKSLIVAAEGNASVRLLYGARVYGLAADQTVSLQGLSLEGIRALELTDNAGAIFVDGCSMTAQHSPMLRARAAQLERCSVVTFSACTLRTLTPSTGNHALEATDSHVLIYDSILTGGDGAWEGHITSVGGAGAAISGGFLFASGSRFVGGDGSDGSIFFSICTDGGEGAPGILAHDFQGSNPEVVFQDSQAVGGRGGQPSAGPCRIGPAGPPVAMIGSGFSRIAGPARKLSVSSPKRANERTSTTILGLPGESVRSIFAPRVAPSPVNGITGILHPDRATLAAAFVGSIPANGALEVPSFPAQLFPGSGYRASIVQMLHAMSTGELVLGAPRLQIVLR